MLQIGARVIEYEGTKVAPTPEHGLLEEQAAAVKADLLAAAVAEVDQRNRERGRYLHVRCIGLAGAGVGQRGRGICSC